MLLTVLRIIYIKHPAEYLTNSKHAISEVSLYSCVTCLSFLTFKIEMMYQDSPPKITVRIKHAQVWQDLRSRWAQSDCCPTQLLLSITVLWQVFKHKAQGEEETDNCCVINTRRGLPIISFKETSKWEVATKEPINLETGSTDLHFPASRCHSRQKDLLNLTETKRTTPLSPTTRNQTLVLSVFKVSSIIIDNVKSRGWSGI